MLMTRNNRNAAAAIAGLVARKAVDSLSSNAVKYVGDYLTGGARPASSTQPTYVGGSIQKLGTIHPRKGKKRLRKRRQKSAPSRNPPGFGNDRIRVTLRDMRTAVNTAASTCDQYYQLAINFTANQDMRTWLARANTLSGSFRFFKVRRLIFEFTPSLAYTSPGYIALGVDPDPSAAAPGAASNVFRHNPSCLGDIKDKHQLIWTPGDDNESLDHIVNAGAITTAPTTICQGSIQIYSQNTEANAAVIGYFVYEVDIEFWGLF